MLWRLSLCAATLASACHSPPESAPAADASTPDAVTPPDALVATLGPSLVLDDFHIAELSEALHAFALLAPAINPMLETAVIDGTLLFGLELRGLDDPSGQDDDALTVGMYSLTDTDSNPDDNFDPDSPELFGLAPGSLITGEPAVHFTTASIDGGALHAEGVALFTLPGDFPIPLPLQNLTIDGDLRAATSGEHIRLLEDARMVGAVPVSVLALVPNIAGAMCPGQTLLDVLATGCGFANVQPDVDLDGDGPERFYDTDDDGSIDRCIDGDGTETTGVDCPTGAGFADGYRLVFVIHGVRALLIDPS